MLRTPEEGQSLAEYALILALIALVAIIAFNAMGGSLEEVLKEVATFFGG